MPINIALLGTGNIVENALLPALQQVHQAQFWSVLSRDYGRARAFAEQHGAAAAEPAYDDLQALLADPQLDAVIIATPDKLHAEQTIAAARHGKHVLVEKPMATDYASGQAMLDACREAGVKLAVAYHLHWHPGHRQILEWLRNGKLGTLRHMRVQWSWPAADASNWRASAEVGRWWSLAGVGTHCLDLIRWMMLPSCGEIEELKSIISRSVWQGPHDESAVLAMRFASGATAELCSSVLFQAPTRAEIYGSDGYILCEGTLGRYGSGHIRTHEGDMSFTNGDPYVGEIEDFVAAIQHNRAPEVDGIEGLRNIELLLQASEK